MRLLIDEPPLQVLPSLAEAIGINEAIILQQIHYWLQKQGKEHDGRLWTYNSYPNWQKQFPFWSESSIKRTFHSLEEKGLLIAGNYNKLPMDKTKWYTIDYSRLDEFDRPSCQNEPTIVSDCTDHDANLNRPIPETTSETSSNTSLNKKEYAKYVHMTEEEYKKLCVEYGQAVADEKIEDLNNWKGGKGKKTKDDYLTIRAWIRKEARENINKSRGVQNGYDRSNGVPREDAPRKPKIPIVNKFTQSL